MKKKNEGKNAKKSPSSLMKNIKTTMRELKTQAKMQEQINCKETSKKIHINKEC